MRRLTGLPACVAVAALLAGCSSRTGGPAPPPPPAEDLRELAGVYEYLAAQGKPPPKKLEDLREFGGGVLGAAWPKLESGDYVVFWGAGRAPGSSAVLAYESKTPTDGGAVLLQDGTVTTMTAAEFQAARKAGR